MLRDSPYQGLRPFTEDDADFFFGRGTETRIISANLRTRRLTVLYGPSGVGKSSVLQAGVIPHLRRLNALLSREDVALTGDFETSKSTASDSDSKEDGPSELTRCIVIVTFESWIKDPHALLKDKILTSLERSLPSIFTTAKNDELRKLGLRDMLAKVAGYPQVMELLIILDQFEQYFVYNSDEKPGGFADEFCRALSSRKVQANFLISIREDWLGSLDRFTSRVPNFFDNSIRIEHTDRDSAKSAIRGPIDKYNEDIHEHEGQPGFGRQNVIIEEEFIEQALDQLEELDLEGQDHRQASTELKPKGRIEAAGLQIVLQHLWNEVKNDFPPTFSKELLPPGQASEIFRAHLDGLLKHLGFSEKRIAERLLSFLVSSSRTNVVHTAESLAKMSAATPEAVNRLIAKLTKIRVLDEHRPLNSRPPLPFYEITIRNWIKRRRLRRLHIAQLGRFVAIVVVLISAIAGFGLTLLNQRRETARVDRQRLAREQRLKAWDTVRASFAKQDSQVPYLKKVLRGHDLNVTSASFTSDGQILTASADGSAILWDPETAEPIRVFAGENDKAIVCTAISPDGNWIVTANTDGTVLIWGRVVYGVPLGGIQLRGQVGKHVTSVSFNAKGDLLAAANTAGDLLVWNVNTLELVVNKAGNGKPTRQISFSPSGSLLAAASEDFTASVWRTADWSEAMVLSGHSKTVNGLAFSPDEHYLATASADTTVRLWNLKSGDYREFTDHTDSVNSVDFDPSGQRLLSASDDKTARIWSLDNKPTIVIQGHANKVLSASFSPDGSQVVTGSRDATARIWSASSGNLIVELQGHKGEVSYVSYSKDGKYVLTASDDTTARVWFAPESEPFQIDTPVIKAKWSEGPCPLTVSFDVSITAHKGVGSVTYRFKGSDGRIWPSQELVFNQAASEKQLQIKYLKWYWRITESTIGSETFEVIEPKGIKEQTAKFKVTCNASGSPESAPEKLSRPGATPSPPSSPPPSPASLPSPRGY